MKNLNLKKNAVHKEAYLVDPWLDLETLDIKPNKKIALCLSCSCKQCGLCSLGGVWNFGTCQAEVPM